MTTLLYGLLETLGLVFNDTGSYKLWDFLNDSLKLIFIFYSEVKKLKLPPINLSP